MTAGKTDMDRLGLFSEVGYTTIGDRYPKVDPNSRPFNESAHKGKHILSEGFKSRSALQAGYFDSHFKRIMEREAYSDPVKLRRQQKLRESQKNLSKAFLPTSGDKLPSGLGSHYGTFSGRINAFSPAWTRQPFVAPGRNFTTIPGKRGTGYGYVGVTIGHYHEHAGEAYDKAKELRQKEGLAHKAMLAGSAFKLNLYPQNYFDQNPYRMNRPLGPPKKGLTKFPKVEPFKPSSPSKKIAGAKAGTFNPYPSHSNDPYTVKDKKLRSTNMHGKIFNPAIGTKSRPVKSILTHNVVRSVNRDNYKTVRQVTAF